MIDLETAEAILRLPDVRERLRTLALLDELPLDSADARDPILERIAPALLAEAEIISLSALLTIVQPPDIVDALLDSDDWLRRWSLLPWTNEDAVSPLADVVRRKLAFDDHPLVSAEAHQHLMIVDEWQAANASTQAIAFAMLANHGPAVSFRSVTTAFVESWPSGQSTYDLEELRAFAADRVTDDEHG